MKQVLIKIVLIATILGLGNAVYAQKYEIKAFEKQNKEMLKQLKKQYGMSPDVKMSGEGGFYIVLTKKDKQTGLKRFFLIDETGAPLYNDWLDAYNYLKDGNFFVVQSIDGNVKWGVLNINGRLIFPIKYDNIQHIDASEAGTFTSSSRTYWHPANKEVWLTTDNTQQMPHHTFYAADGCTVLHEYEGEMKIQLPYFYTIEPVSMSATDNKKGLLTLDGEIIFPQEYNEFYIDSSGFVDCIKREPDGLSRWGGKMLDGTKSDVIVPPLFFCVIYLESTRALKCKVHRDDVYEDYDPQKIYEVSYKDKGERLYDMGKYQEVIAYYEGEGYGTVWGDYYMGLAAENMAQTEMKKMDNVLKMLNSSNEYYLPLKNPEKYKFDAGTIAGMCNSAGNYFEKYINNENVSPDDPTKVKARKKRGEIIATRNSLTMKLKEYETALQTAWSKNVERERRIAEQKAMQEQKSAETARAVQKLIGNLFK